MCRISVYGYAKNAGCDCDPEMHQNKKGIQCHFGMKVHIVVDADSGMVHMVCGASGNFNDLVQANSLLRGEEADAFGDATCQATNKRPEPAVQVTWHIAMSPSLRQALDLSSMLATMIDRSQQILAGIRAEVAQRFRVMKLQLGFTGERYRRSKKNAVRVQSMFAMGNLRLVQCKLMAIAA